MKIVGILALVGSVLITQSLRAENIHGFNAQPWSDCVSEKKCAILKPKPFSADEISFLNSTIQKFKQNGLSKLIEDSQRNGYKTFARTQYWVSTGLNPIGGNYSEDDFTHAMIVPTELIVLTDKFFENPSQITLLHELVHTIDIGAQFSNDPEFYINAGFENIDVNGFTITKFVGFTGYRLPREYSKGSAAEAFADVVAFVYFDPLVRYYMNPKLIEYADKHVLHGARSF